ncbi:UNVERIFIED_CONTAM: hypothetical protein RMT77_012651 [Armadillidium vulgare]
MFPKRKFLTLSFLFSYCCIIIIFINYKLSKEGGLSFIITRKNTDSYDELNCSCPRYSRSIRGSRESSFCSDFSTSRGKNQSVVSYSIYGNYANKQIRERYYNQIEQRVKEVNMLYKGWIVRLYHEFNQHDDFAINLICNLYCSYPNFDPCNVSKIEVPNSWLDELKSTTKFYTALKVYKIENGEKTFGSFIEGKVWRFLPMGDKFVSKFIVRDVDSFILEREVAAVNEWLKDYRTLIHVMRDHPTHKVIILGGMWGGLRTADEKKITHFFKEMFFAPIIPIWDYDQGLLRVLVWPNVKNQTVIHDSYTCRDPSLTKKGNIVLPFPTQRQGKVFISWGPLRDEIELNLVTACPLVCRPKDHQDWKYC